jgi:hypothetical protein
VIGQEGRQGIEGREKEKRRNKVEWWCGREFLMMVRERFE